MDILRHQPSGSAAALRTLLPWSQLDDESVQALLSGALCLAYERDAYLDAACCVVVNGVLAIERSLSDGRRVLADLFHDGGLVDLSRSARAVEGRLVTVAPSEVLVLEAGWIEACAAHRPSIGHVVEAELKRHQSRLHDHITDLAAKTPLERVASLLFEFRRWPGGENDHHGRPVIRIPIRRTDIADYLGMKPETLSRAVRCLEQERMIRTLAADQILIADLIGMRRVANGGRPRRSTRAK